MSISGSWEELGSIKFGDIASIERYLEQRCGYPLHYLKAKGVLHLVAKDFANQSISTKFGDLPFNNKLVLILTDPDSGLSASNIDITTHDIIPILTAYLKDYGQPKGVERFQSGNNQNPNQGESQNHFYGVVLAVIGITLSVLAAYSFGTSSTK